MKEKIYEFEEVIDKLKSCLEIKVKLENRPKKYMFGTNNYGELVGFINKSDGDRWDVIVPGYKSLSINKLYKFKNLEGVILLPNGNHKLIIDIYTIYKRNSIKKQLKEIENYRDKYEKIVKIKGCIIMFNTHNFKI